MGKRIISAAAGILLLVAVLFISDEYRYIFNGVVSVLAAFSVWEIFTVTQAARNRLLLVSSLLFAAAVPFFGTTVVRPYRGLIFFAYLLITLCIMLLKKQEIPLQTVSVTFMLCTLAPYGFSLLVTLRDMGLNGEYGLARRDGVFLLLLALGGAWLADTGAYFVGRFLGKHKLSPTVSPKKTVEGFIGGAAVNLIGLCAMAWVYQSYFAAGAQVNLPFVLVYGLLAAFLGTLGDLSASYIKRTCHVKDFGSIMPGHGGVLDRFDSILLVAPLLYLMLTLLQNVWPLLVR